MTSENDQSRADYFLKILGVVGAVFGFLWGVYTYHDTATKQLNHDLDEANRFKEARRIEATKPFLEHQLKLYKDAARAASILASSQNQSEIAKARERFWELYWGELALVEDDAVETAMVKFGRALNNHAKQDELTTASLDLAHACRDSLANSWSVNEWRTPGRR